MNKPILGLCVLFILLTSYTPSFNFVFKSNLNIKKIIIENNSILDTEEIKKKLSFLYEENLFLLNLDTIDRNLTTETFIESFSVKKIYPHTLKLIIIEKNPIAIIQNKKQKSYISDNGELIKFLRLKRFENLPTVIGNEKNFYSLYKNLQNIKFPLQMIKSFYYFDSGRWDLIMKDDKVIKLPKKDYLISLQNFMSSKKNIDLKKYKIFDYRIKDQLILN